MAKIGLLGGTFDPIHLGHINLAFELLEKWGLDLVWFIPARHNPLKVDVETTAQHHRVNMLHKALEQTPQFEVQTVELERTTPSYTVDTLRKLLASYPHHQFFLLLGEDLVPQFPSWKEPHAIVQMVPVLIGSRSLLESLCIDDPIIEEAFLAGWTRTSLFDISGTEIRHRLASELCCSHLLPAAVLDYIQCHHLYR